MPERTSCVVVLEIFDCLIILNHKTSSLDLIPRYLHFVYIRSNADIKSVIDSLVLWKSSKLLYLKTESSISSRPSKLFKVVFNNVNPEPSLFVRLSLEQRSRTADFSFNLISHHQVKTMRLLLLPLLMEHQ